MTHTVGNTEQGLQWQSFTPERGRIPIAMSCRDATPRRKPARLVSNTAASYALRVFATVDGLALHLTTKHDRDSPDLSGRSASEHHVSQLKEYSVMAVTIEELRERAELLEKIARLEGEANWTDLGELRERAKLLTAIKETE
jgi:hypothetical protein